MELGKGKSLALNIKKLSFEELLSVSAETTPGVT